MSPTCKEGVVVWYCYLCVYLDVIFFIELVAIQKWNPLSQKAEALCKKKFTKNDVLFEKSSRKYGKLHWPLGNFPYLKFYVCFAWFSVISTSILHKYICDMFINIYLLK
jgi:hypothetical protein